MECCAVSFNGDSETYSPYSCSDVSSLVEVDSSYNVSAEWRNICLWAVVIQSMTIAGALCFCTPATIPAATCLHCLSGCGGLAWIITATVFVFRAQGDACGNAMFEAGDPNDDTIVWYAQYLF